MSISYCSNGSWDCADILIEWRILGIWKEVSGTMNVPVRWQSYVGSWHMVNQLEAGLLCRTFHARGRQNDQRIDVAQSTLTQFRGILPCSLNDRFVSCIRIGITNRTSRFPKSHFSSTPCTMKPSAKQTWLRWMILHTITFYLL
jgi:hypothetical protein